MFDIPEPELITQSWIVNDHASAYIYRINWTEAFKFSILRNLKVTDVRDPNIWNLSSKHGRTVEKWTNVEGGKFVHVKHRKAKLRIESFEDAKRLVRSFLSKEFEENRIKEERAEDILYQENLMDQINQNLEGCVKLTVPTQQRIPHQVEFIRQPPGVIFTDPEPS